MKQVLKIELITASGTRKRYWFQGLEAAVFSVMDKIMEIGPALQGGPFFETEEWPGTAPLAWGRFLTDSELTQLLKNED